MEENWTISLDRLKALKLNFGCLNILPTSKCLLKTPSHQLHLLIIHGTDILTAVPAPLFEWQAPKRRNDSTLYHTYTCTHGDLMRCTEVVVCLAEQWTACNVRHTDLRCTAGQSQAATLTKMASAPNNQAKCRVLSPICQSLWN
eukprot:m.28037 g.28037  ORF g.28037 m.28037 type:complete len:144 (-) comp9007_c1_seq1:65-496(-)